MSKNAKRQLKALQEKQQAESQAQFQAKLQELISLATAKGEGCLDELIHDLKSSEASSINNSGVQGQVDYIVESCDLENAITQIKEVLDVMPNTVGSSPDPAACAVWKVAEETVKTKYKTCLKRRSLGRVLTDMPKKRTHLPFVYRVNVCRIAYGNLDIEVAAPNKRKAKRLAEEEAANHVFTEHTSEYQAHSVTRIGQIEPFMGG